MNGCVVRVVAVAAVVVGGLGCGGESEQFSILQDQVPSEDCVVNTERTLYAGEGLLDLLLVGPTTPFAYQLYPLLQNNLPGEGNSAAAQGNRLFVRAFRVRVEPGPGSPAKVTQLFEKLAGAEQTASLVAFQESWAGTIDPGGGLLAASVTAIPGELARQIRNTKVLETTQFVDLVVRVRAVGQRRGTDIESQEFVFPIRACEGCLIASLSECPMTPKNLGHACNVAQDRPVDCCSEGADLICPSKAQ